MAKRAHWTKPMLLVAAWGCSESQVVPADGGLPPLDAGSGSSADSSALAPAASPDAGPAPDAASAPADAEVGEGDGPPPWLLFARDPALALPPVGTLVRVAVSEANGALTLRARTFRDFVLPCESDCLKSDPLPPRLLDAPAAAAIRALVAAIPVECAGTVNPGCDPNYFEALTVDAERLPLGGCAQESCPGYFAVVERLANLLERLATPDQALTDASDCSAPGRGPAVLANAGCACDWPFQLVCADGVMQMCGSSQDDNPHRLWTRLPDEPCVPRGETPCTSPEALTLEACMKTYVRCYPAEGGGYCGG
jgi:hypothetical protein